MSDYVDDLETVEAARLASRTEFWERVLPAEERRDALWMVLAGTAISAITGRLSGYAGVPQSLADAAPGAAALLGLALRLGARALLVALLVFVALRLLRAPRQLGLYMLLGVALDVLWTLVFGLFQAGIFLVTSAGFGTQDAFGWVYRAMVLLAVAVGVLAGAWLSRVFAAPPGQILEKARTVGFDRAGPDNSGYLAPAAPAHLDPAAAERPSLLGWDGGMGSPATRVAVWLVLITLPMDVYNRVITVAQNAVLADQFSRSPDPTGSWLLMGPLLAGAVLWMLVTYTAVFRFDAPRAVWLVPAGTAVVMTALVPFDVLSYGHGSIGDSAFPMLVTLGLAPLVEALAAGLALLGVHLATREDAATMSGQDAEEPAAAPIDTSGGDHG